MGKSILRFFMETEILLDYEEGIDKDTTHKNKLEATREVMKKLGNTGQRNKILKNAIINDAQPTMIFELNELIQQEHDKAKETQKNFDWEKFNYLLPGEEKPSPIVVPGQDKPKTKKGLFIP
jgi:hypothetical protein